MNIEKLVDQSEQEDEYLKKFDPAVNFQEMTEWPSILPSLKEELILLGTSFVKNKTPFLKYYDSMFSLKRNSISGDNKDLNLPMGGGVGMWPLPKDIAFKVHNYFAPLHPYFKNKYFMLQLVNGGDNVYPHIDGDRKKGFWYLLKNGGSNVCTTWWSIKDEYKHLLVEAQVGIARKKLEMIQSEVAKEDSWYYFNFDTIHSVENLENFRLALYMIPASVFIGYLHYYKDKYNFNN